MPKRTKYDKTLHPDWAWALAIQGKTTKEIADAFEIGRATLNRWMKANPELEEAILTGRDASDAKVERSLYERAIGYAYTERKVISSVDKKTGRPTIERIETTEKIVPPDTTAQIYWLKNRQRDRWKDKWEVDVNTDKEIIFNVVGAKEAGKQS